MRIMYIKLWNQVRIFYITGEANWYIYFFLKSLDPHSLSPHKLIKTKCHILHSQLKTNFIKI